MTELNSIRTERSVIEELSPEAKQLLQRVLQIERSKLHLSDDIDSTIDDILNIVKGLVQ